MNNKIRELADRAGEYADFESGLCTDDFLKKFAELIIRDCVRICVLNQFDGAENYNNGSVSSSELIKEHFGVEF